MLNTKNVNEHVVWDHVKDYRDGRLYQMFAGIRFKFGIVTRCPEPGCIKLLFKCEFSATFPFVLENFLAWYHR